MLELRLFIAEWYYAAGRYLAPTRTLRMVSAQEWQAFSDLRWATHIFFKFPADSPEFSRMFYKIEMFAAEDRRWRPLVSQAAKMMGIDRDY